MYWHTYSNFIKGETIIKSIDITIQDKEGVCTPAPPGS